MPAISNLGAMNIDGDNRLQSTDNSCGIFNNMPSGIINKNGSPSSQTAVIGITSLNNGGLINITSGNRSFDVTGTHTGNYNIGFGAGLQGATNLSFAGDSLINNGTITISNFSFTDSAIQYLHGYGDSKNLTINDPSGVMLTETQVIKNIITVSANGKLKVYRNLVKD